MVDFDRLYSFRPKGRRRALHVHQRGDIEGNLIVFRGELAPKRPIVYDYMRGASGSTAYDLVSTSYGVPFLVSRGVVDALQGFRGWMTFRVELYGKQNERVPGYSGLVITGRCGPIQPERSEWIWREPAVPHGKVTRALLGIYFDEATWDGTDLFVPEKTGAVVIVQKVKDALEAAKISNASIERLSESLMSPIGFHIRDPESDL